MPSEGPEGRQTGQTHHALVLLNNLFGVPLEEKVNVQFSASGDVTEGGSFVLIVLNHGRLGICVSKVNTAVNAGVRGLNEGEGVHAVGLEATASVIILVLSTSGPHGPSAFSEGELVVALSKSVDPLRGQFEVHLNILVHH